MKHIKLAPLMALFIAVTFTSSATIAYHQVITGRVVEKETGRPVPNCRLWVHSYSYNFSTGQEMQTSSTNYECTSNGEFVITNFASRCEVELADSNKYQDQLISGPVGLGTNDWGTIEISMRPFYFESCVQQETAVSATIVNTTGKKAYMRFWLTGQLTRLDDSEYFGCSSGIPLKLKLGKTKYKDYATYQLVPGENEIGLEIKDYGPDFSTSNIMISGGLAFLKPMMPSVPVFSIQVVPPILITNPPPIWSTNFPPILITNLPPIIWPGITNPPPTLITNFPPMITNFPPVVITNLPPYTTF